MFRNKVDRSKAFKKGIDADDCRRKREDESFSLRKTKRDEQLVKRRLRDDGKAVGGTDNSSDAPIASSMLKITNQELLQHAQDLSRHVAAVNSYDTGKQLESMRIFRRLLSIEDNPPIQNVIDAGVVPRIAELMTSTSDSDLSFEAAWVLTNIASGTAKQTQYIIELGVIPKFVQLLSSRSEEVRDQAVWALGNIAGDCHKARNLVIQANVLPGLMSMCTPQTKLSTLRNTVWAISNLCRGKPQPDFRLVKPALPLLTQLLHHNDDEILTDACWAISYLSDDDKEDSNNKITTVIESGCVQKMVHLLGTSRFEKVQTPALRALGNLVTGNERETQAVLNCGILKALLPLLSDGAKKAVKKEACWALSNITAGNASQIQAVIEAQMLPGVISLVRNAEWEVRKEAAWTVCNAITGATDEQIKYLLVNGVIPALSDLLDVQDARIIMVALEGMDKLLQVTSRSTRGGKKAQDEIEECGGLDKLEALQRHDNEEIYKKSIALLKTHFDSDDVSAVPEPASNQNQFMFGSSSSSSSSKDNTSSSNSGFNFGSSSSAGPLPVAAQQQPGFNFGFGGPSFGASAPMFSFA